MYRVYNIYRVYSIYSIYIIYPIYIISLSIYYILGYFISFSLQINRITIRYELLTRRVTCIYFATHLLQTATVFFLSWKQYPIRNHHVSTFCMRQNNCPRTKIFVYGLKLNSLFYFSEAVKLDDRTRIYIGKKRFWCSVCQRTFAQKSGLDIHTRIHTGEKPFSCDICKRRYTNKQAFKYHMLTHGEKNFSCSFCQMKFVNNIALNNHTLIHSGEKPYGCSVCQKTFSQKSTLKKHTRIHAHTWRLMLINVIIILFSFNLYLFNGSATHTFPYILHKLI